MRRFVTSEIASTDQVGYIKGRRASTVLQFIGDVIDQLSVAEEPDLLVTIHFPQAFNRISNGFMLKAVEKLCFDPDFVNWLHVPMKNTELYELLWVALCLL